MQSPHPHGSKNPHRFRLGRGPFVPFQEFLEFFEIFRQRGTKIPLMQRGGGMDHRVDEVMADLIGLSPEFQNGKCEVISGKTEGTISGSILVGSHLVPDVKNSTVVPLEAHILHSFVRPPKPPAPVSN